LRRTRLLVKYEKAGQDCCIRLNKTNPNTNWSCRKKFLKELVWGILDQVEANASEHIVNVMQGWKGSHNVAVAEVKMDSGEVASRLSKQFASKKKAAHDFGSVYIVNSVK
jgi:3-methyladenine DNA glycosylase AlkC